MRTNIDLGQDVTVFDRYDLSFKIRAKLTRLINGAFAKGSMNETSERIMSFVEGPLQEYGRANKDTHHTAVEAIDYILAVCRNKRGKALIPSLSKQLNVVQNRMSGSSMTVEMD